MMKRFMLALCAGILAAAIAAPVFAADLPRPAYKAPYKNPVYVAPFSWTGFYLGINGGYALGKSNWTAAGTAISTGDFSVKGGLLGGTFGYQIQTGGWVWGVEGDLATSSIKGSTTTVCGGTGCETTNNWFGTGRGRIGYAWDVFLPYLTAGVAYGNISAGQTGTGTTATATRLGWTGGGGVEWAFMNEWSAKLEYLYADLGKFSCDPGPCGGAVTDVSFKTNIVRLGVNYRF